MSKFDITLGNFLTLLTHKDTNRIIFNFINTNNNTFPEEYRRNFEHAAGFWMKIYKDKDPLKLFDKVIDYIVLLPNGIDMKDNDQYLSIDKVRAHINNTNAYPVIHIFLKTDN